MIIDAKKQSFTIKYWHKIVLLLCLGWVVIWIYRPILTPILPELQETVGTYSNTALGWIASCYFFAYTMTQVPAGILVDKYGKKIVLIPSFIVFTIAVILIANATTITTIYIGSLLAGLGCGSYYGVAYSLAAENVPAKNRGFANALINTGCALGMSISLIGASYLVKTMAMPWQYLLYFIAALLIIMTILFMLIIKEKAPQSETNQALLQTAPQKQPEEKFELRLLFRGKIISFYIMYFASCYVYYMIVTWLPNFLETERGFTGGSIGMASSAIPLAAIFGALIINGISDLFKHRRLHMTIVLAVVAAIVLIITLDSVVKLFQPTMKYI